MVSDGSVPAWAPLAGGIIAAVICFYAIANLGGSNAETASNSSFAAPTLDAAAGRPTDPSATVNDVPTPAQSSTLTLQSVDGSDVEVPADLAQAIAVFIKDQSSGARPDFDNSTVNSVNDAYWELEVGFTTESGRFLTVDLVADISSGSWVIVSFT